MWLWKSQHYKLHLTVNLLWWFFFFSSPDRWNSKKIPFAAKKQEKWWYHIQVLSSTPFILHCNDVRKGKVNTHILCQRRMKKNGEKKCWRFFVFVFCPEGCISRTFIYKSKGGCSAILVARDPSDGQICCRWILIFQQEERNYRVKWPVCRYLFLVFLTGMIFLLW